MSQAKKEETIFTVYTPPHVGFYKLEIYASRVPKTTGKINLPLVATFMLEVCVKMTCCKYQTSATQVRLKGYGDKASQESSFQNRRGTQEMMSAERRLSRFLFSFIISSLRYDPPLHD